MRQPTSFFRRALSSMIVMIGVLTCSARAWSQSSGAAPGADTSASSSDRADELHAQGLKLMSEGQPEEARKALLAAFELKPAYDIAGNLGAIELEMKRYRDAAEHLAHSLRTYPTTGNATARQDTERRLQEAAGRIATVQLTANVEGARFAVDGTSIGRAPLSHAIFVTPGEHMFAATAAGHQSTTQRVTFTAGERGEVSLTMVPDGGQAIPHPSEHPLTPVLITGYGLGGALVATSVVLGIIAAGRLDDGRALQAELEGERAAPCAFPDERCGRVADLLEEHRDFANPALWLGVGGGVTVLATLIYHLASPSDTDTSPTGVTLTPVFNGNNIGITMGATW